MRKALLLLVFAGSAVFAQEDQYGNKDLKKAKGIPQAKVTAKQKNGTLYTNVASVEGGEVTTASGHKFTVPKKDLANFWVGASLALHLKNGEVNSAELVSKNKPR